MIFKLYTTTNILLLLASLLLFSPNTHAREFHVEGSDLLMGVGADAIGLSGAVAAGITGIHSVYWNPAGLAELDENELSLSRQLNSKILPLNFAGIALSPDWLQIKGFQSSIALSWIPRLHMQSTGAYSETDIESIFLRLTLPGLAGDFDGTIESKTKDNRLTWAIMPEDNPRWSAGVSISKVDCETFFCGVTAHKPGEYIITSTKATAYAFHVGGKYYYNEDFTFGFNFKDINTALDVGIKTEFEDGSETFDTYNVKFPQDITLGMQWQYNSSIKTSLDYQKVFGHYGSYNMDFHILRSGIEYTDKSFRYRFGLLAPLKLKTNQVADYSDSLLFPVAPSFGLGWRKGNLNVDLALYTQLIMSAQREALVPGLDISITHKF